jgi:hypothetical protein
MRFRFLAMVFTAAVPFLTACRSSAAEAEIRHDVKYLAVFSSPALVTADDDKKLSAAFQSKYKSRVVLLRPVTGLASLTQSYVKASLFAVIKINPLREARAIAREIEQAIGNASLAALYPLVETANSQDNFSGSIFYLGLEKRNNTFTRLSGSSKLDTFKTEADEFGKDRNVLSYFAAALLSDTPYHTVHLLGFSGLAESQYETLDGFYHRALKKLESADTVLVEKVR